jgi:para-nitrobenzyl esterase
MTPRVLCGLLLLSTLVACQGPRKPFAVAEPLAETERTLALGRVVGGAGRYGSHAWLGLPYAAPPVGAKRWRAPQRPSAWEGVREALRFGAPCVQQASPLGGVEGAEPGALVGSEDCLTLNAWAPPLSRDELSTAKLPVMVWIHGGGNSIGAAAFYEPGRLAREQGLLVFTLQYRLGPLGFFRHPALRAGDETPEEQSGNFALLDLVAGLQWVRDNAAAFGGDPGNVTVFGESAGGFNTYALLLSPHAKGLFHRAIVQSGGLGFSLPDEGERFADGPRPGHVNSSNEVLARAFVKQGYAPDAAGARRMLTTTPGHTLAETLRKLPQEALYAGYDRGSGGWMLNMPFMFRDGVVLPEGEALAAFRSPLGWNRVPVMVGTNRDEQKLFLFLDPAHVEMRLGMVPHVKDEPNLLATSEYLSRAWRVTGAEEPAAAMRQSGAKDVFLYRFDWDEEPRLFGTELSRVLGAAHGLEIPFVFGHFSLGRMGEVLFTDHNAAGREALSSSMRAYWGSFARGGRPEAHGQQDWMALGLEPGAPRSLVLDTPAGGGIRMTDAWESRAKLLTDLQADPRLSTAERRCRVRRGLVGWRRLLSEEQYAEFEECRGLPASASRR